MTNDTYRLLGQALNDAKVKYAFVVLENNQIIEIGNLYQMTKWGQAGGK